jgi:hypothetical protein
MSAFVSSPPKSVVRKEKRDASAAASSARMLIHDAKQQQPNAVSRFPSYAGELSPKTMQYDANGRNYTTLARTYPIEQLDPHVLFDEARHRYTVRGELVPRSATKVVSEALSEEPFDGDAIILKNLASWKSKPKTKYGAMIVGLDDEAATKKIKTLWESANVLGTKLHKRLEAHLNNDTEDQDGETDVEWETVAAEVSKVTAKGWVARRTELSMWWERIRDGKVVCAGQLDALFSDENDNLIIVDLKRTDKDLSPGLIPFKEKTCAAPLAAFYANDYVKYSLQTSIYAVMFAQRTGLEIHPDRRWLLQAHPSKSEAVWTQCRCFDKEAIELLEALE